MGEMTSVTGEDGFALSAWRATPSGERKGGVIVVQEIFGLDEHVRRDADRWASAGFEALAPSLFDRREKDFLAGHDAAGMQAGIAHARATPLDQALADIAACRNDLAARGRVFIVGYCYGGSLAWLAAGKLEGLTAASSYYGSLVEANAALTPLCPTIVHLGADDPGIASERVKAALIAAQPNVPVYVYPGAGHGFNNEDPARHDVNAAELARRRTLELFGG